MGALPKVSAQQRDTLLDNVEFTEIVQDSSISSDTSKSSFDKKKKLDTTELVKIDDSVEIEVQKTLFEIFIAGFLWGLLAFLMPCIFPMLPLTISYFIKKSESRGKSIRQAIVYGLSIIIIYVALGLLVTIIFGSSGLNSLSASGLFNFCFFLLLVVFSFSFFGAFEITLPNSFINRVDSKVDSSSGLAGTFFMAASLALVSFSCTGPIIGTLLVQASSKGELLAPAIGMFGFSLALSLPFTICAIFPGFLNRMPKSGGWLNSVKVCLGFLELALSLKFLSVADTVWGWEWFDREIFLVLWITIFFLMGIYLLGKLKFSYDSNLPYISVPRLLFAILSFAFAIYMIPGLWGAPVGILSGLAPPINTQDFMLNGKGLDVGAEDADFPKKVKYDDSLRPPIGFQAFFELEEGLEYAKKVNKPILIDFTGHSCTNCRRMEDLVWSDKEIASIINEKYVLIQLYVDDRNIKIPKEKTHYSKILKRNTDDLGYWNLDFQATRYGSNAQPLYVLAGMDLLPLVKPQGAVFDVKDYLSYLQSGLLEFNKPGKRKGNNTQPSKT